MPHFHCKIHSYSQLNNVTDTERFRYFVIFIEPDFKSAFSSTPLSGIEIISTKKKPDGPATEQIQATYTIIKQYLDPRYGMLDQLYVKGILRHEELRDIKNISNPETCSGTLLDHLLNTTDIENSLKCFKEILRKDHSWIYNTIWGDANDLNNTNNRPLSEELRRRIIFNKDCFIKLIDPCKNQFISKLAGDGCITESQYYELCSRSDKEDKISELLNIVVRRSFAHFQLFIHWLNWTLQGNIVHILKSNGVVLNMHIFLQNKDLEKRIAEILIGALKQDSLFLLAKDKRQVEDLLKSLEERGLFIVGGAFGSLIVYILCLSVGAVNDMAELYKSKELETMLNSVATLNATIKIDDEEFARCRRFFSKHSNHDCNLFDMRLNEFPIELFDMIMKRATWWMWVCFVIKTLLPGSSTPLSEYLKEGARGFSKFVNLSSTDIYRELSSVCIPWREMFRHKRYGESIKSELLLKISRMAIGRSKNILIENLCVQDGLLERSLDKTLITIDEKTACESTPEKSNEMFIGFLYNIEKRQIFAKLMKFLFLLEERCKGHLVNHVISFGIHWLDFENRWPLDKMAKELINAACGSDLILRMDTNEIVASVEHKLEHTTTAGIEGASYNLVSLLFKHNCITADQRDALKKLKDSDKPRKLMRLLRNGSTEMFEIVIDYLNDTRQDIVLDLLQPIQEVRMYGRDIVNCLKGATEILNNMIEKKKIASSLLDNFSINGHTVHSGRLNRFQENEVALNILACSKLDVFIYFLNFLLINNQHAMLLPMFQSIPHSMLLEKFESYLIDSIEADENFLLKLFEFNVINHSQMRTIESKRTSMERNKELLNVVSKTTPKSFSIFLTVLVESGRSNILANMQLIHSEPEEPVETPQVENAVETVQKNQPIEKRNFEEMPTDDDEDILPYEENVDAGGCSQLIRHEENIVLVFTLETKGKYKFKLKTIKPLSCMTSGIIRKKVLLLTENILQNLVFMKIAILRKPAITDLRSLSLHVSSLLGYLSDNLNREIQLSRMIEERKLKARVENFCATLITSIDPTGHILQTLLAKGVLTPEQKTEVESVPSSEMRSKGLLRILFTTKHPEAFSVFMKALERDHAELVQTLTASSTYNGEYSFSFHCVTMCNYE